MPYAFSVLFFVLGLITGIPAIPQLLRMRKIKSNSSTTTGAVYLDVRPELNDSTEAGLMSSIMGKISYPKISYKTSDEKERTIEVIQSSSFQNHRYKSGDAVVVVYDKNAPWLAYLQKEWDYVVRDLWMTGAELLLAVVFWSAGLALKIPI